MSFAAGGKGVRSDVNVTPLIDVVLVLLIVFMVLVPKLLNQTAVDVPPKAPDNAETPPASDQLVVAVGEDGRVAINGEPVLLEALPDKVREILQNRSKKLMFFNPDDNAPYGDVIKVMDICRGAGAKNIGIMTK